uniref:Uncharacterized protein n=1 Tax=Timspurckia oligopyrenoides TaxID=708627 RepID=A0A7S0ZKM7_9RHOD|mmetsp:Transcript_9018/g.16253  ORF Transcript_9018/g.16253 Transcript_9018/m.16253 type:complete len:282 (+) Transcript_9018:67-912(+)
MENEGGLYCSLPRGLQPHGIVRGEHTGDVSGVHEYVQNALVINESTLVNAEQTVRNKLQQRVLLLDYQKQPSASPQLSITKQPFDAKRKSRRGKPRNRAAFQTNLRENEKKYKVYEPIALLWADYAYEQLENLVVQWRSFVSSTKENVNQKQSAARDKVGEAISRMEFHGAFVKVERSSSSGFVGVYGIIALDTSRMWSIVDPNDKWIQVPKHAVILRVYLPFAKQNWIQLKPVLPEIQSPKMIKSQMDERFASVLMNGAAFTVRPADRSMRKWKKRLLQV